MLIYIYRTFPYSVHFFLFLLVLQFVLFFAVRFTTSSNSELSGTHRRGEWQDTTDEGVAIDQAD